MSWRTRSIFGRILPGYLGDKLGRFNIIIITIFFLVIVVLTLWISAQSNVSIIVFAIVFGFSSGIFVSVVLLLIVQISDIRQIGVRNGTNFFIVVFAALCGNPIGDALISRDYGEYFYLQLFSGLTIAIGGTIYVALRHVQVRS